MAGRTPGSDTACVLSRSQDGAARVTQYSSSDSSCVVVFPNMYGKRTAWLFFLLLWIVACQSGPPESATRVRMLLVANQSANSLTIVDLATGDALANVLTGLAPHQIVVLPGNDQAVVGNYGTRLNPGSTLGVVDLATLKMKKIIDLGRYRRPHGLAAFNDGRRVAVTVEGSRRLLIVDIAKGTIEKAIPTGHRLTHMVVLSPDERWAYVTNVHSGTASRLDLVSGKLDRTVHTGAGAEGLDLSPDGNHLWIANRVDNSLSIIDTVPFRLEETVECAEAPIRVRFSPAGEHVLVSAAKSGEIVVFSAADRRELRRISMAFTRSEEEDAYPGLRLNPVPVNLLVDKERDVAYVANANADLISKIDLKKWQLQGRLRAGPDPAGMALAEVWRSPSAPGETRSRQ